MILPSETINLRLQRSADYFSACNLIRKRDWQQLCRQFLDGDESLPVGLALAHPGWDPPKLNRVSLQGIHRFEPSPAQGGICESASLWGYRCPIEDVELELDHVFPWSLGGPTRPDNRLVLCFFHNRSKSSDIHCFPWERDEPGWLRPLLTRIMEAHIRVR